jgi:hypothetical protein
MFLSGECFFRSLLRNLSLCAESSGELRFHAPARTPNGKGLTYGLLTANPNLNPHNLAGASNPFRLDRSQAATNDQDHDDMPEQLAFDAGLMELFPLNTGTAGPPGTPPVATSKGLVMGYYDGYGHRALELRAAFRQERQFLRPRLRSLHPGCDQSGFRANPRRHSKPKWHGQRGG